MSIILIEYAAVLLKAAFLRTFSEIACCGAAALADVARL